MSAAASEALLARKERLAGAVVHRFYQENPRFARPGPAGTRERLLQDVRHTVEQLAPAVGLGDPSLFCAWVRELLGSSPGPEGHGGRHRILQLIDEVLDEHLPGPFLESAHACLEAGLSEAERRSGPGRPGPSAHLA